MRSSGFIWVRRNCAAAAGSWMGADRQCGPEAAWGHHRMFGWPSCEYIVVMIAGVVGQPAELRRSQGANGLGRALTGG